MTCFSVQSCWPYSLHSKHAIWTSGYQKLKLISFDLANNFFKLCLRRRHLAIINTLLRVNVTRREVLCLANIFLHFSSELVVQSDSKRSCS